MPLDAVSVLQVHDISFRLAVHSKVLWVTEQKEDASCLGVQGEVLWDPEQSPNPRAGWWNRQWKNNTGIIFIDKRVMERKGKKE